MLNLAKIRRTAAWILQFSCCEDGTCRPCWIFKIQNFYSRQGTHSQNASSYQIWWILVDRCQDQSWQWVS